MFLLHKNAPRGCDQKAMEKNRFLCYHKETDPGNEGKREQEQDRKELVKWRKYILRSWHQTVAVQPK